MKNLITLLTLLLVLFCYTGFGQNSEADPMKSFKEFKAKTMSQDNFAWQQKPIQKNADNLDDDYGDAPQWDWAEKFAASGKDYIKKAVSDDDGNIYLVGDFSGTMLLGVTVLTSIGHHDLFVAKADVSGNILWLVQGSSGTMNTCSMKDIFLGEGYILATGYFEGEVFGIQDASVNAIGSISDAILLKVSLDGQVELLKNYGGGAYQGVALAEDNDKNIYLTGYTDGDQNYTSSSFLAKLDAGGTAIWWQEHAIAFNDVLISENKLYVAGTVWVGTALDDIILAPFSWADAVIAKANLDGFYEWAVIGEHNILSYGDSYFPRIEAGNGGYIYLSGYFRNYLQFGDFQISSNLQDVFIVKINDMGEVVWAKATTNTQNRLDGFAVLENDKLCISGAMEASAAFDDIVLETPNGGSGFYMAVYDSSGQAQSAFNVQMQTTAMASYPGNKILQSGASEISTTLSNYDFIGNHTRLMVSTGNSGTSKLTGLEADSSGIVFSLNNIYGYADFYGVDLYTTKETMVLAAQKPNGDLLWHSTMPGGVSWYSFTETSLKLDEQNNHLFLHGDYNDTLQIGGLEYTNAGKSSFIACFTTSGQFLWAKDIPYNVNMQSVDCDLQGNVYFSLTFSETINIDGYSFTSNSDSDALVLKYSAGGEYVSAKHVQTDIYFYQVGIAVQSTGGYYLTLEPAGDTIFFNNGNDNMLFNPNTGRCVVAKYDEQGNYLWAKSYGYSPMSYGGHYAWPTASQTDDNGNLYLTGSHADSAIFDDIMLRTPYHELSPFTAKIDANGNALWANSIQIRIWGNNYCEAEIDNEGNFYCMGDLRDTMNIGNWVIIPEEAQSMYVASYDNDGEARWVKTIDGASSGNHLYGMAVYAPDNLFVGGGFRYKAVVGETELYTSSSQSGMMIHIGEEIPYSNISDDDPTAIHFDIRPNPVEDFVYLDFEESNQKYGIELIDMQGKVLQQLRKPEAENSMRIDLSGLSRGAFFIQVSTKGKSSVRKIIIQ